MNCSFVRAAACTLAAAAVTAVLLAVPASTPSLAASVTFSDPNCTSFTFDGTTLTCVGGGGGGGGGGAFTCSIGASPSNSTTVGTNVSLSASCSGGTAPYTYGWSGGGAGGCPAIGASGSPQALTSPGAAAGPCGYTLNATDSTAGTALVANANKNVTWAASGGGGGGGGGNINCNMPNGGATHVISAGWLTQGVYLTSNAGGFGPNDAIVVKFTTSSITTSTKMGSFNGVEYVDGPTPRYGTLSDTPCDFSTGLPVKGGGQTVFNGDIGISAFFSLFNPKSGGATLAPNTTYYINIANVPGTCGGSCNMQITIKKPGGT